MESLTIRTYAFIIYIIITLSLYICVSTYRLRKESSTKEKSHIGIINALSISYQNVYVIDMETGELFIYHLSDRISSIYGDKFRGGDYEENFRIYVEKEVYEEDKKLFDNILTIEKVRKIFSERNEYSFVYRIVEKGEIHFYQCFLLKPDDGNEFVATFKNVDDVINTETKINQLMEEKTQHLSIVASLAEIYLTLHLIDLEKDMVVEFNTSREVKNYVNQNTHAKEQMEKVMTAVCFSEYIKAALEFTDLDTIADRLKDKKYMSAEFNGRFNGWFRAIFIPVQTDAQGKPVKVMFATQVIENEKRHEEMLISNANTDELTGFLNRRAYEEDLRELRKKPLKKGFVYISLDVNGLKTANDTLGHAAGDELLRGCAECIKSIFGKYGKLYRTGGDEFQVIINQDDEPELEILKKSFEKQMKKWKGKLIKSLSISYGCVKSGEFDSINSENEIDVIVKLADKRMYEAKSQYYELNGKDRRKAGK